MEPRWNTSRFNTSVDGELTASLATFVQLYDQHKDSFQRASKRFMQAAARAVEKQEDVDNRAVQALFSVLGGAIGAVIGGVFGGIWGAVVAVGAAAYIRFYYNINEAGEVEGAVFGGVVGGAVSGFIGGSAEVAVLTRSGNALVGDLLWFIVGFVTGREIGDRFGGPLGKAGGGIGGAIAALHATRPAMYVIEKVIDLKKKRKQMEKIETMQKTGADFSERIKPLVDELKTVQRICDKMTSDDAVKGVADQTSKTLTAVTEMEKSVNDSETEAGGSEFLSCVNEASSQCRKIPEELQRTGEEAEKLL